jgi:cobalt-zinc-cadmium efflux system membrane fusion protein
MAVLVLLTLSCQEETVVETLADTDVAGKDEPNIVRMSVKAQRNFEIETAAAGFRQVSSAIAATGVIGQDPSRVAHMSPLTRGRVEKVFVSVGDTVKRGQPLLEYDNIELGEVVGEYLSALASLEKSNTQLAVAEKFLERAQGLLEMEAIARKDYELRDARHKESIAEVNMARARLTQIHVKLHRFGLSDEDIEILREESKPQRVTLPGGATGVHHREFSLSLIKSPFEGVIIQRDVAIGETIEPGQELLTLVNTSTVWVAVDIYEKDLSRIQEGQRVRIRVAAYPDEVFTGEISRIGDVLDAKTRTVKAVCVVSNPEKRLKLQMFTNVAIETEKDKKILAVPSLAIQTDRRDFFLYVRKDDTHFEKRIVRIGDESEEYTEILDGLAPGEEVVTAGAFYTKSEAVRESLGEEHD